MKGDPPATEHWGTFPQTQADAMMTIRVGLHSLVLVMVDLGGMVGGALAALRILGIPNQVQIQLRIAVAQVDSLESNYDWTTDRQ
jgi:hypothetical protein